MIKFSDLDLDPKVLKAIDEAGYVSPTPIQASAIPLALQGRDVLGIAQTGTGKTASFTLPMITKLAKGRARARMPRSLVLCPTRELAAQVAENFEVYAKHLKLTMALLIGGVSFKEQDQKIDRGVDVLIATPGRLLDHFERGKLMLNGVQIMVVDEADRMLDMGFIPDIERIFKLTPFTRQTLFFSATMAPEITRITQEFLQNPERVEVARQATTGENITQKICMFTPSHRSNEAKEKREILREILKGEGDAVDNGIIFCNRKSNVDIVMKSLKKHGFDAGAIHGDLDQSVRTKTLEAFRSGDLKLLVASDVAARGLDVPAVSHVINFDVPIHSEDYVHRIGRTGRAGRDGKAITICAPFEEKYLEKIEELVEKKIDRMEPPALSGGKKSRSNSRKSEPQKSDASDKKTNDKPEQSDSQPAKPVAKDEGTAKSDNSRNSRNRNDKNSGNGNQKSDQQKRGRSEPKNPVVGMGDHVPAFLMRSFEIKRTKTKKSDQPAETEVDVVENQVTETQPAEEKPVAEKKKRAPRKKAVKKTAPKGETVETTETSTEAPAETPEAQTQEAPVEDKANAPALDAEADAPVADEAAKGDADKDEAGKGDAAAAEDASESKT
ncbi:DEAD/DEAH box helicase [Neptunicoccus cionae]|uniref:DEAD-box ATP-dependent RNA helicase RhpA n=1 Tax=Neptunicoccus cionae TaxID=2035344 RepID=A0A916VRD0_9RHOB|nr:DEAD/DEAH box helicase [Amylibacter cionae]GGA22090.1 DEAD/DEAH box helicase [Amylibacter cionae]